MAKFVPIGREDPMATLCRMVLETKYEDLPGEVTRYAKHSILDTIAVTMGGSAMEGVPAIVGLVKDKGGKPESYIPFYGGKAPASEVGLAVGPMSRAMDLGQVHLEAGHCSEYIVPALLAATGLKGRVTGKEFITAFVLGQELLLRIGIAYKVLSKSVPSGRGCGHFIFGCVASIGKLLGFNTDELENAQGIARGKTQPHDQALVVPPTLMIRVHHGFICQDAINACLLAKSGITGPRQEVLTGVRGYLGMAKWETDPGALTRSLGEEWEMLDVAIKVYASCLCTHTSIEGILDQMKEHRFGANDIGSLDIDVSSQCLPLVCIPKEVKWNPRSVPECQFSLAYAVATAAFSKNVFLESYTPHAMAREDVRKLMTRVSAKADPSLPSMAARLNTTLKNGEKYSKDYIHIKGYRQNPLTEDELISKFKKCVPYSAYKPGDAAVDSVIDALLNLEKVDDLVKSVICPLTPKNIA